jgi:uncharacterized protein YecE (DUF72 family)
MDGESEWRIDRDLPDEEEVLKRRRLTRPAPGPAMRIGTSGWSYEDWEGPFYAPGTRPDQWLGEYARSFSSVEIDSTFYGVPREATVRTWEERSPAGFIFAAKLPRDISHEPKGLAPGSELLRSFLDRMALLGDKLGPLLIQFPPRFKPAHADGGAILHAFLESLPQDFRFAVEFRDAAWHQPDVLELLAEKGIAWVCGVGPDSPPMRPLTADFTYLRWLGDRRIETFNAVVHDRRAELQEWAHWIEAHRERLREIYGYFNNHYTGHAPATAREFLLLLGQDPPPPPVQTQGELFQ